MDRLKVLNNLRFGEIIAEDEANHLEKYFVETYDWEMLMNDEIDVVLGPKGSGKSAIYQCLLNKKSLEPDGIIIIGAEKPRGTPAFEVLGTTSLDRKDEFGIYTNEKNLERKLVGIWKLYFIILIGKYFKDNNFRGKKANQLIEKLEEANLIEPSRSLKEIISNTINYVKQLFTLEAIEPEIDFDPNTGNIKIKGKIKYKEPTRKEIDEGYFTLDDLLTIADSGLNENKKRIWVCLDRLDGVFDEDPQLELFALRALFKVYLGFKEFDNLKLKIFLRDDIWDKITDKGFRELTHVTARNTTIKWGEENLINLIVKRIINNDTFSTFFPHKKENILSNFQLQEELLSKFFPKTEQPISLSVSGTQHGFEFLQDGNGNITPRVLIYFLSICRKKEIERIRLGKQNRDDPHIISFESMRLALKDVSDYKLNAFLFAEYSELKKNVQLLKRQKTNYNIRELEEIWNINRQKAKSFAQKLIKIGFFEEVDNEGTIYYYIAPLYRPSLEV